MLRYARYSNVFGNKHDSMIQLPAKTVALIWTVTLAVAALLGAISFVRPADEYFGALRSQFNQRPASGDIVVVGIDDDSLDRYGGWPWKRETMAQILDRLDAGKPDRILFDVAFGRKGQMDEVAPLESMAAKVQTPVYFGLVKPTPIRGLHNISPKYLDEHLSGPAGRRVYLGADLDVLGVVFELPFGAPFTATRPSSEQFEGFLRTDSRYYVPSLAVIASGKMEEAEASLLEGHRTFKVDHRIDPTSIPSISLVSAIDNPDLIRGKTVVVAPTARTLRDIVAVPFQSELPGVFASIMGAETLKKGVPTDIGWIPPLSVVASAMLLFLLAQPGRKVAIPIYVALLSGLTITAGWAEANLVFMQIMPAMAFVSIFYLIVWRAKVRARNIEAARRDRQTGLPNLSAHIARLERLSPDELDSRTLVAAAITNAEDAAILLNDQQLNRFYTEIARRIAATGDQLVVHRAAVDTISWDIADSMAGDPEAYARSIRAMMLVPFQIDEQRIRAEITLGFCETDKVPATRRVSNAMHAVQRAASQHRLFDKHSGRSAAEADWRLAISGDVRELIAQGEISLVYQPKLDLKRNKIIAAEALMRWNHGGFGYVPPSDFIPLAEQGTAIVDLTEFALREALKSLARFRAIDPKFTVAINLSPVLLDDHDLIDNYAKIIDEFGYEPSAIMFEITEAARISNAARGIGILESMVERGMHLSIDDYGTGHSTLEYLRIIPAHEVKLDRSFVENLLVNAQDRDLVGSTIELAHKLGLKVVAEGVENVETIDVLERLNCDIVQGYCVGRPVSPDELRDKIAPTVSSDAA